MHAIFHLALSGLGAAYLLCNGKANDIVSLWDVPCHNSILGSHLFDGHIDRRRQAICKQKGSRTDNVMLFPSVFSVSVYPITQQ